MSSRTSSASLPEFFLDRGLGRTIADTLRQHGWVVHRVADAYPADAQDVSDADWIVHGSRRGWALLTKDKRIRWSTDKEPLRTGWAFCLSSGQLDLAAMSGRFVSAQRGIERAVARDDFGFHLVYAGGRVVRRWP